MSRLTFGALVASLQRCWKGNHCSLGRIVRWEPILKPYLFTFPIDVHQFSIITELLGTPPEDVIKTIASENVGFIIHWMNSKANLPSDAAFCEESSKEGQNSIQRETHLQGHDR